MKNENTQFWEKDFQNLGIDILTRSVDFKQFLQKKKNCVLIFCHFIPHTNERKFPRVCISTECYLGKKYEHF